MHWSVTYDTCANEALLFNLYAGTGSLAISAPLSSAGTAVTPIAFNPFNPVSLAVNQNSSYIYAPSVNAPTSPSPGSPEVVFFAPPSTCAGGGGGGGGTPAPDALTLSNVPVSAGSGAAISFNVVLQSSGTGTPTGPVTITATGSGGMQAVTVPAALALAGGSTGTPVSLIISTPGLYNVIATYPGDANFAAATSPTYNIEVTQPAPASGGVAILIPGIIGSQNATTGTAGSILSSTVFDAAGNFYVLDSGLGQVTEYPVSGSPLVIVPQSGNSFALTAPSDMILEADGSSLLISDFGNNRLVRVALGSAVTITALPQSSVPAGAAACANPVSGTNLCWPTGLAEDASGNIYVSDMGNGRVLKLDPFGNYLSTLLSAASSPLVEPLGLAIDAGSNLYVANSTAGVGTGSILKLPALGTVQTFLSKNITQPYGLAVDPAGDLYFSDSGTKTVSVATGNGTVYLFAGNGAATDSGDGAPATGAGIAAPLGLTVDTAGNLYIGDSVQQPPNGGVIRKVTASQAALAFGNVSQSTASAPQQVILLNAGGASLSIASAVVSGTNSSDFALTNSCGAQLAAAATCSLSVIFTPSTAAAESALLTVTDNSGGAAAATQVVQLTGTVTTVPAVASPVFSPPAGSYLTAQSVSITSPTSGAAIHYTTDGSAATPASPLYSAPITVSATETLSAIAVESGYNNSPVVTAVYTIGGLPAAAPTFTPAAGTYANAQSVTLSSTTPGSTIYYTTNGSTPTPASTAYTGAINVAQSETIQAIATAVGFQPSVVASAAYLINPSFSVLGKAGSTTDSTGASATIGSQTSPINATGTPQLITLFLTPANGFNSAVTISSDFSGADSETWFCSNSTGTAAVSCTIPATNLSQPFYVAFLSGVPPAPAVESPVHRHSHPHGLQHRPTQVTAGSLGLAGSIGAMILFGVFWRRRGIFQAVIGICFIATIVSMSVMLAGCNPASSQFTVTATPSTSTGVSAPGNGAAQTVNVWVNRDTSN